MVRTGCTVVAATPEDCERVVDVLMAARIDHPVGPPLGTPDSTVLASRLAAFLDSGNGRASLASVSGVDVGVAIGHPQAPGLFSESPWYEIEVIYVRPEYRRRGAGRMLLADQLAYVQDAGLDRIVTQPVSGARSEARFLSRLGFAALGARRTGETAQVARRLELDSPRRGIESLIKRRRALSGMTPPRGIPLLVDRPDLAPLADVAIPDVAGAEAVLTASLQSESSRQVRRAELMRRSSASMTSTR